MTQQFLIDLTKDMRKNMPNMDMPLILLEDLAPHDGENCRIIDVVKYGKNGSGLIFFILVGAATLYSRYDEGMPQWGKLSTTYKHQYDTFFDE